MTGAAVQDVASCNYPDRGGAQLFDLIDFDVLEQHDGLERWDLKQNHYGGKIAVTFERDTTNLHIDLDYQYFWARLLGKTSGQDFWVASRAGTRARPGARAG